MPATPIGVDPHKRSHTAVVLDDCEDIASEIRVTASPRQVDELLAWAPPGERVWAIENANGLGRLLAQQLVVKGETVIDVPAALACRARKLSGRSGRKTDEFDARAVAIAATYNRGLRQVQLDNVSVVLGLLVERRWQLVSQRQRAICQLHALLTDMVAAGAKRHLTSKKAAALLRTIPAGDVATLERKLLARELIDDVRRLDRRIPPARKRIAEALTAYGSTLTQIHGIGDVGAATIIGIVDDPTRFPTAGHFAAFTGTAPLQASSGDVERHRLSRRGNRQLNKVQDPDPPGRPRPHLLRPQGRRGQKQHGGAACAQATAIRRRLPPTARRPPGSSGPGRTSEDEPKGRVTGFNLHTDP